MAISTNGVAGIGADTPATLTNKTLTAPVIDSATFTGQQTGLEIAFGQNIVFEGTTADAFELTLTAGDPTADRTITLPDATGTVALTSNLTGYITASSTDTLTNKTLTAPVVSSVSNGGTITIPSGTDTLVGRATTDTLTNKTLTAPVIATISNSGTLTLPAATDTLVGRATTDTLTNKTLTAPVVTNGSISQSLLTAPHEDITISATAATGTVNFDAVTQGVLYYTTAASGNWTLNVRGDGSTTLNSLLAIGESITVVFLATQTATAYYATALTIDGSAVTPKYQGGTAWVAGNASSIDAYSYTIMKTASATFTVLASQTKFA